MAATSFDGVALIVTDIEQALHFYRDRLGVEVYSLDDYPYFVEFLGFSLWANPSAQEAVFGKLHEGDPKQAWGQLRRFPVSDMAFTVEDVDAVFKRMQESGPLEVAHPPKTEEWGQRTARFFDSDGHLVEIAHWLTPPEEKVSEVKAVSSPPSADTPPLPDHAPAKAEKAKAE